uniref:Uncharacterized protein n=1 Tax=Solanum lycopersicum TaxID=4081 RepID=A0A3Q7H4L2_SOLLC
MDSWSILFNKNGLLNGSTHKYTKKELVSPKVVRPCEYKRTLNDRVFSFMLSLLSLPLRRYSLLCSTTVDSSTFCYGGLTFPTLLSAFDINFQRIQNRVENPTIISNIMCEKEFRLSCSSLTSSLESSISEDSCKSWITTNV